MKQLLIALLLLLPCEMFAQPAIKEYMYGNGRPVATVSNLYSVFSDVPANASYAGSANLMDGLGITTGCGGGQFCPIPNGSNPDPNYGYLPRWQMAVFLVRAWSIRMWGDPEAFKINSTPSPVAYFTDALPNAQIVSVPNASNPNNYVSATVASVFPYIQKLKELGITNGCGGGQFCPGDLPSPFNTANRTSNYQIAVFGVRTRKIADLKCIANCGTAADSFTTSMTPYFTDVGTGDTYFHWIQATVELGAIQPVNGMLGCSGGAYCENSDTYRGQMAMFVVRMILHELSF